MSRIYTLIFFIIFSMANATVLEDCGLYKLRGTLKVEGVKKPYFLVFAETKNQMQLKFKKNEDLRQIAQFVNQYIEIESEIKEIKSGEEYFIEQISNYKLIPNDKLKMNDDVVLLKKMVCH